MLETVFGGEGNVLLRKKFYYLKTVYIFTLNVSFITVHLQLTAVCHEAALYALQEDINAREITESHFTIALETIRPGTNPKMLKFYEEFSKKSGLHFV